MKKTISLGLVCIVVSLLACEKPPGPVPCSSCTTPLPNPVVIHTMHPSIGEVGDEVVLVVGNLPENAVYSGSTYQSGDDYENAPRVSVTVGDESATVLSVADQAVTIKIPEFLDPGDYWVTLTVGSHTVRAPSNFEVHNPAL